MSTLVPAGVDLAEESDGTLRLALTGSWRIGAPHPLAEEVLEQVRARAAAKRLVLDGGSLADWDSSLLTFLVRLLQEREPGRPPVERSGLPEGVNRLLALAFAAPRPAARPATPRPPLLARIGEATLELGRSSVQMLAFIGEVSRAFFRLCTGRGRLRRSDLMVVFQETSIDALPIVSLISLLVGLILAFVGAIQLRLFGAQIYVADLVGIGMTRALGAVMTGIVMAGRSGASFAAQIGTMQVNEEIDALQTTGISPVDYLVLPRVLALSLALPLLTLYADLMGIHGGFLVAVVGLGLSAVQYYQETIHAVSLTDVAIGVVSGLSFGVLVAVAGCLRGLQCGRSASAVGEATTLAVVTGIVSVVVATAVITTVSNALGI
jgi:phospholipid/cholesterol/gamma-HCH transport system permease protein